ncbi:MAG: hypothetical protein HUU35_09135, partial [Armatimonadetes bacterium]|nr:hypothetical protein [Armatimonadota bacterium]
MMRPGSPRHLWLMAPGLAVVCFTLASIALPVGSDGLGAHLEQGSCPASSMAHWARDLHDGFWRTAGANPAPPVSSRSIAQAFCAGGEAEQAIALYRRIGVRNEDDIASLCALAERLTLAGDWTRAEWYVREADMLLHGGMLRNNLAWHYTQTDQRPSQALALALSATLADRVAATVDTLAWAY